MFLQHSSLKSLKAPGVTKIGDFAFAFINYLATAEFSEIKEIGKFAFERCNSLRKGITFSSECKEIPQGAFEDCYNIRGIELKEGLEKMVIMHFLIHIICKK